MVFFKHFASKNQLPGLSINGTLVENGLIQWNPASCDPEQLGNLVSGTDHVTLWGQKLRKIFETLTTVLL